jgi:hypothetical protein
VQQPNQHGLYFGINTGAGFLVLSSVTGNVKHHAMNPQQRSFVADQMVEDDAMVQNGTS